MKDQTRTIIKTVLDGDESVTGDARQAILRALNGTPKKPRMIDKKAVALLLGCHPASVCRYVKRGLLHPVKLSCRKVRYIEEEAEELAFKGIHHEQGAA